MAFLRIQDATNSPRHFELKPNEPVIIGRSPECPIRIHDQKSSRQHLRIDFEQNQFVATDLKSFNGTLLNDQPLTTPSPLKFQDELKIGYTVITLVEKMGQSEETPYRLTLYLEEEEEKQETFTQEILTLGRLQTNDIALKGVGISGKHAEIQLSGDMLRVVDQNSRNGIRVNGKVHKNATLLPGDIVEVGSVKIRFDGLVPTASEATPVIPPTTGKTKLSYGETQAVSKKTPQSPPQTEKNTLPEVDLDAPDDDDSPELQELSLEEISLEEEPTELENLTKDFALSSKASQAKKTSNLPLVLLLLGGTLSLTFIGAFWIYQALHQNVQKGPSLEIPGNLIGNNYSFEIPSEAEQNIPGWQVPKGAFLSEDSFEGKNALAFPENFQAENYRNAFVQQTFDISAPAYELKAHIKQRNNQGLVGLVVVFQNPIDKSYRQMEFSPFLSQRDNPYQELRFIFAPPQQAKNFRVGVFSYGKSNELLFDQVVLLETETLPAARKSVSSQHFTLEAGPQGFLRLSHKNKPLLSQFNLSLELEGRTLTFPYSQLESMSELSKEDQKVQLKGKLFDPIKSNWFQYQMEVTFQENIQWSIRLERPISGNFGLQFELDPDLFEDHLLVLKETDAYPFKMDVRESNAIGMVCTAAQKLGFQFPSGRLLWQRDRGKAVFHFSPQNQETSLSFDISVLPRVSEIQLDKRLEEAKKAQTEQKFGNALKVYSSILTDAPFSPQFKKAEQERDKIKQRAAAKIKQVETQVNRARFFQKISYLEKALILCQEMIQQYEGSPYSLFASQLAQEMERMLQEAIEQNASEEGTLLLKRADDFKENGYQALSAAFYQTIEKNWPNTPQAKEATEKLQALRKKD